MTNTLSELPILIIDDDSDMCWVLRRIIEACGHRTVVAHSGRESLALYGEGNRFAIAFVDLRLPDIEGMQLAKMIAELQPRIEITAISGYFSEDDPKIVDAIRSGVISRFLAKPFDIESAMAGIANSDRGENACQRGGAESEVGTNARNGR
ncbi:response regulator [Methylosinus sp. KRF6]|uniref:response regulator n=1 Tax=Methylosinus sp. KRF6 TaxID=2846853 RepID=UPI001C0ABD50|nr:response regulator [Methylosinus sp. KRF6]MBU3890911.1 response regulator [Methylosinus sp. KRF6]